MGSTLAFRLLISGFLVLATSTHARAQEYSGMEIELTPAVLEPLTHVFDWSQVTGWEGHFEGWPSRLEFLDHFLDTEAHLEFLPASIRDEIFAAAGRPPESRALTDRSAARTVQLTGETALPPPTSIRGSGLILPGAATRLRLEPSLRAPALPNGYVHDGGLILPEGAREARQNAVDQQTYLRELSAWRERAIQAWRALPLAHRQSAIPLAHFPRDFLAHIARLNEFVGQLHFRTDLPEPTRQLLGRLQIVRDGEALELRHRVPLESVDAVLRDAEAFARLAGVQHLLFPSSQTRSYLSEHYAEGLRSQVSLHIHYTPGPEPISQIASLMNVELLLHALERNDLGAITHEKHGFRSLSMKGLIRLIDPGNRVEFRYFGNQDPDAVVRRFQWGLQHPREYATEVAALMERPELRPWLDYLLNGNYGVWRGRPMESLRLTSWQECTPPFTRALLSIERLRPGTLRQSPTLQSLIANAYQDSKNHGRSLLLEAVAVRAGVLRSPLPSDIAQESLLNLLDYPESVALFQSSPRHLEVKTSNHGRAIHWINQLPDQLNDHEMSILIPWLEPWIRHLNTNQSFERDYISFRMIAAMVQRFPQGASENMFRRWLEGDDPQLRAAAQHALTFTNADRVGPPLMRSCPALQSVVQSIQH